MAPAFGTRRKVKKNARWQRPCFIRHAGFGSLKATQCRLTVPDMISSVVRHQSIRMVNCFKMPEHYSERLYTDTIRSSYGDYPNTDGTLLWLSGVMLVSIQSHAVLNEKYTSSAHVYDQLCLPDRAARHTSTHEHAGFHLIARGRRDEYGDQTTLVY
ncbi:hypothetical protein FA95DRAFT_238685 [Auriscalpium vulgare]|uniref:Uncharacterized protein n=1 Tax=Auriscalpium vulgare TaxID=40419 RepID=A0ACB8S5Z6_9AGAM|nr:hypothetical protein FA95DRAFT_238685 [Auriscalpium vulgare]